MVVEAADGYRALFSVAELDPAFGARADPVCQENGQPIQAKFGALQVVATDAGRRGRQVRQVERLRMDRYRDRWPRLERSAHASG